MGTFGKFSKQLWFFSLQHQEVVGSWDENGSIFLIVPGVLGLVCFTHCQSLDVIEKIAIHLIKVLTFTEIITKKSAKIITKKSVLYGHKGL